jgi:hypothetical protein
MPPLEPRREGFHDPKYCPRQRTDCKALAQIIGVGHASFTCCGERQGDPTTRAVPTDAYRFCHKSCVDVDLMMNHDQRDMAHIAATYSWALAAVIAVEAGHGAPPILTK